MTPTTCLRMTCSDSTRTTRSQSRRAQPSTKCSMAESEATALLERELAACAAERDLLRDQRDIAIEQRDNTLRRALSDRAAAEARVEALERSLETAERAAVLWMERAEALERERGEWKEAAERATANAERLLAALEGIPADKLPIRDRVALIAALAAALPEQGDDGG